MGTIDKLWVKLSCDICGEEGVSAVLEKDSGLSGLDWGNRRSLSSFDVSARGEWKRQSEVISAMCRNCGAVASVKTAYGIDRPEGF